MAEVNAHPPRKRRERQDSPPPEPMVARCGTAPPAAAAVAAVAKAAQHVRLISSAQARVLGVWIKDMLTDAEPNKQYIYKRSIRHTHPHDRNSINEHTVDELGDGEERRWRMLHYMGLRSRESEYVAAGSKCQSSVIRRKLPAFCPAVNLSTRGFSIRCHGSPAKKVAVDDSEIWGSEESSEPQP